MASVELTVQDVQNLIGIINGTQFKGESAETIVLLKQKLMAAVPPPAPSKGEPDGKTD